MCTEIDILKSQGAFEGMTEEEIKFIADSFEPVKDKLQEYRDKYTVVELKKILKEGKVSGYSKLNQDELIQLALDNNLL